MKIIKFFLILLICILAIGCTATNTVNTENSSTNIQNTASVKAEKTSTASVQTAVNTEIKPLILPSVDKIGLDDNYGNVPTIHMDANGKSVESTGEIFRSVPVIEIDNIELFLKENIVVQKFDNDKIKQINSDAMIQLLYSPKSAYVKASELKELFKKTTGFDLEIFEYSFEDCTQMRVYQVQKDLNDNWYYNIYIQTWDSEHIYAQPIAEVTKQDLNNVIFYEKDGAKRIICFSEYEPYHNIFEYRATYWELASDSRWRPFIMVFDEIDDHFYEIGVDIDSLQARYEKMEFTPDGYTFSVYTTNTEYKEVTSDTIYAISEQLPDKSGFKVLNPERSKEVCFYFIGHNKVDAAKSRRELFKDNIFDSNGYFAATSEAIFFSKNDGIYRWDFKGQPKKIIDNFDKGIDTICISSINIVNKKIYFHKPETSESFKSDIDGSNIIKLDGLGDNSPFLVLNNRIYFDKEMEKTPEDFNTPYYIYRSDVNGLNKQELTDFSSHILCISDSYIYYSIEDISKDWIDYDKKTANLTNVFRMKLDGSNKEHLKEIDGDVRLVSNGWIYFIESETNNIYKIKEDMTGLELIYAFENESDGSSYVVSFHSTKNYIVLMRSSRIEVIDYNGKVLNIIDTGELDYGIYMVDDYIYFRNYDDGALKRVRFLENLIERID